jgi:hypothetical protein
VHTIQSYISNERGLLVLLYLGFGLRKNKKTPGYDDDDDDNDDDDDDDDKISERGLRKCVLLSCTLHVFMV